MDFRYCTLKFSIAWLCWTLSGSDTQAASTVSKRSLADNIQTGIKFAGKILGKFVGFFSLFRQVKRANIWIKHQTIGLYIYIYRY